MTEFATPPGHAVGSGRPLCRHCGVRVASPGKRGLCWSHYRTKGLRDRYTPVSKYGHRGVGNGVRGFKLPRRPTTAPPGTPEKVAAIMERARRGEQLWHPHDERGESPPPWSVPVVRVSLESVPPGRPWREWMTGGNGRDMTPDPPDENAA